MDADLESFSRETLQSTLSVDNFDLPSECAMCQRTLSDDNETGDLEAISICGDCRFLFLEDRRTPIRDFRRRAPRVRRTRYGSSESIENPFSQQFSNIINMARQNHPSTVAAHENQSVDRTSSRTTPSGSRRWRRVVSDTESDGFDSIYGESESNVSFSGYRVFHGGSDTVSFSAYGGDSDASVDGHSMLDNEIFTNPNAGSDLDTDTDIDPMHVGLNQWDSDDQEEEEDEEEEWEEADSLVHRLQRSLDSSEANEGASSFAVRGRRDAYFPNIFRYAGNSGDYLDARGFEELLEHLAETDSSRRGAPPAAVSFVNNLPRVVISEDHEKQDNLTCAICKDFLSLGSIANQLPCFHLYHPSCILPWLSARNTCPLCRYEVPTDDKEYEECRLRRNGIEIREIQQEGRNEDSSSDMSDDGGEEVEACEIGHERRDEGEVGRGRWFYLAAAAPIVSLVGIVIVLWLGNPLNVERRGTIERHSNHSSGSFLPNQRENRSRRWWSLF